MDQYAKQLDKINYGSYKMPFRKSKPLDITLLRLDIIQFPIVQLLRIRLTWSTPSLEEKILVGICVTKMNLG